MSNTFSRRQFVKVTGGFVAGATSVASIPLIGKLVDRFDLISPAQAQTTGAAPGGLKTDKYIALENLGANPSPDYRFLDGRTGDGTVGLAPSTEAQFTGTRWLVREVGDSTFTLENQGANSSPDFRFLNGRTGDGTVGLAPSADPPYTGTQWLVREVSPGIVTLENQGTANPSPDYRFLDGRTGDGTVSLAPNTNSPYTGTQWRVIDLGSIFRNNVVRIAYEEWEFFERGNLSEDDPRAQQRISEYFQSFGQEYTGQYWSAAFISWVVGQAGAGDRFVYSASHSNYIYDAFQDRQANDINAIFFAYNLDEYSPKTGDLVCYPRQSGVTIDTEPPYDSHSDVVVAIRPGEIDVIGGNVSSSVTLKTLIIDDRGRLQAENNQSGDYPWFAILANQI